MSTNENFEVFRRIAKEMDEQQRIAVQARARFRRSAIAMTDALFRLASRDDWDNDIVDNANFRSSEDCTAYIITIVEAIIEDEASRGHQGKVKLFSAIKTLLVV